MNFKIIIWFIKAIKYKNNNQILCSHKQLNDDNYSYHKDEESNWKTTKCATLKRIKYQKRYLHHLDSVEKYNLPGKKNKETLGQFYYLALAGRLHLEGATFNDNKII